MENNPKSICCEDETIPLLQSQTRRSRHNDASANSVRAQEEPTISIVTQEGASNREQKALLWPQALAAAAISLVYYNIGVMLSFSGITLPEIIQELDFSTFQSSLFSSFQFFGMIFGSLAGGPLFVIFGPRIINIVIVLPNVLAWVILSLTSNYSVMLIARMTCGISGGIIMFTCMNYLVEISHPKIRGRLSEMIMVVHQLGFMVLYLLGSTNLGWRSVSVICGSLPLIVPFFIFLFMPDSPRWLSTKERYDEAHSALTFFRGKLYDVTAELEEIRQDIHSKGRSVGLLDQLKIMKRRSLLKRIILGIFIYLFIGFQGNNVLFNYSVIIFESANTGIDAYLSSIIAVSLRVFGGITNTILVDKVGRRPLMIIPLIISGICMACFSLYFYLENFYQTGSISWIPLASLITYTYFIAICMPTAMMINNVIFPSSVRGIAANILSTAFYLSLFLSTASYPYFIKSFGSQWTYLIYAINCFISAILIWCAIPETKGKSLEEIEKLFDKP